MAAVETICIYESDILSCLINIMDMENDTSCLNQCGGLINYLKDDTFFYWLRYFHFVIPHVEIMFQQLQKRDLDVVLVSTKKVISLSMIGSLFHSRRLKFRQYCHETHMCKDCSYDLHKICIWFIIFYLLSFEYNLSLYLV
jgi:hypothetical protein